MPTKSNIEIKFHFYRSIFPIYDLRNISAGSIRLKTNSFFNHCSVEIGGFIYQVRAFHGVIKSTIQHEEPQDTIVLNLKNDPRIKEFITFLESQIGKGYDYKCIFGFISATDINSIENWFCSEYVNQFFYFILDGFTGITRTLVSPKDLYNRILLFKEGLEYAKS